jgi:hypothetical protein
MGLGRIIEIFPIFILFNKTLAQSRLRLRIAIHVITFISVSDSVLRVLKT